MYFNEYAEAIKCFEEAIAVNEDYARAYDSKGKCLLELKAYDAAIDAFSKAIQLEPLVKAFKDNKYAAIKLKGNEFLCYLFQLYKLNLSGF